MTVATVNRFLALLALAAGVGAVITVGLLAAGDRSGAVAARQRLAPAAVWLAWLVAFVATTGSLYYSEVAGFEPCRLCWYQRIAMYPLVILLARGWWRHDRAVAGYVLPLAVIGGSISVYHYSLQQFPRLDIGACAADIPCSAAWVWEFGFISIPYMALSGFALIAALMLLVRRERSAS